MTKSQELKPHYEGKCDCDIYGYICIATQFTFNEAMGRSNQVAPSSAVDDALMAGGFYANGD